MEDGVIKLQAGTRLGDREFEMTFEGKLAGAELTGELMTSRGAQKVAGKKVARPF